MIRTRWIKYTLGALFVAGAIVVGIAYRTTCKKTFRQVIPVTRLEKYAQRRTVLEQQMGAQKVSFISQDGTPLSGYLITRKHPQHLILLCHGYGMAKEDMLAYAALFPDDTILLFDFRAHGESGGELISFGFKEQQDVQAAFALLKQQDPTHTLPVIGLGVSMGGASLLESMTQGAHFDGLIIDATFSDLEKHLEYAFKRYTGLPKTVFMPLVVKMYELIAGLRPEQVAPVKAIATIKIPVLLIHSEGDMQTPVSNVHELYEAAHEPKSLWIVPDSAHAFIIKDYPDEYKKRVQDFIAHC